VKLCMEINSQATLSCSRKHSVQNKAKPHVLAKQMHSQQHAKQQQNDTTTEFSFQWHAKLTEMHNGNRPASHSHNRSTSCTPSHAQNRHNRQHKSQQIKVTRQRQKRNINELNHLQCSSETASKIATEILSTSCKWRHE
jgi:hypothetical protein